MQEIYSFLVHHKILIYLISVLVIVLASILVSRILRKVIEQFLIQRNEDIKSKVTEYKFIKNAVSFVVYLAGCILIFYTIPELRALGLTLFAGAGILAAIIGFASQEAFANIINGVFIIIFRPFRVGDLLDVGKTYRGYVEDITLRHTVIRDFENSRIIIPNSSMASETLLNASIMDEKICNFLEIGISYDANIDLAIQIMQEEAEKHPALLDVRTPKEVADKVPKVIVRVIGFGDSSVNLRGYLWSANWRMGFYMKCDLNKRIKERFDAEGVEIPFPYRTIVFKKDI